MDVELSMRFQSYQRTRDTQGNVEWCSSPGKSIPIVCTMQMVSPENIHTNKMIGTEWLYLGTYMYTIFIYTCNNNERRGCEF